MIMFDIIESRRPSRFSVSSREPRERETTEETDRPKTRNSDTAERSEEHNFIVDTVFVDAFCNPRASGRDGAQVEH